MNFLSTHSFLKLRGVWDTLEILGDKMEDIDYAVFMKAMNDQSYYGSYNRASESLLKYGIIQSYYSALGPRVIGLTKKGKDLYAKLGDVKAILEAV